MAASSLSSSVKSFSSDCFDQKMQIYFDNEDKPKVNDRKWPNDDAKPVGGRYR